ncbi:MAG: MBL fold metallo-hydrolase [Burkholderiales bacterium]|nr:MBL fold metallo-hydrolase [Burkholderiales bacterium]
MKFKFWGVRGSIPSPGPKTMRYGGNTTCIEVRTDQDTLIILDGGTGIFALAQSLLPKLPVCANIFITHSHWDHIHGLPFFTPLFLPGNRVRLHGGTDPATGSGINQVMQVQLQYAFFPVLETEMKAIIEYQKLEIGEPFVLDDAVIENTVLNHPVLNLGYRINCNGKSMFFTGDHEPFINPHPQDHPEFAQAQAVIDAEQKAIDERIRNVDALIVDCSYTREEYPGKMHWGHGTYDSAFEMAIRTGAKALYCTHHEPTRSDDELEAVFLDAKTRFADRMQGMQAFLAYEGLEVIL